MVPSAAAALPQETRMKQQHFWEVDLWVVLRALWRDIAAFGTALYIFLILALPVIIPTLIFWYLLSINYGGNR